MRVLMLTYNVVGRGSFQRADALARPLAGELGHDVTLIAGRRHAGIVRRESLDRGVRVVEMGDPAPLRLRHGGLSAADLLGRIRYVLAHPCDVVHGFGHRPAVSIPARIARRRWGAALVADWADLWGAEGLACRRPAPFRWTLGIADDRGEAAAVLRADAVTAISRELAERARRLRAGRGNVLLVGIGADPESIRPGCAAGARRELGLPVEAPVVVHSGFAPYDVELLADAFALVARRVPEALLVMTGGRFAAVTRRLRAAGVDDRAVQLGELAYERYVRALACADVVALPYRPGAINLARSPHRFGEAMAAGRPIVTNAGGDIAEIVEREKVGVVAGASPAEYAAAIADLLLDGERRLAMGARARRLAEERLSWRLAAARVGELYRGLRPGPPPPG